MTPCPDILINGVAISKTENFTYLGSAITNKNSSDIEVERRIQAAARAFGSLQTRLWSRHDVKMATKMKVYNAAVLPALLYSTECMTLYRRYIKKLMRTQLRHLRQILGIHWEDRVPDVEVLRRANTPSAEALITASQLRWAGHVHRMPNSRLPKKIFYGEFSVGNRKQGGQKLRFKDVLKRHMKTAGINPDTWEHNAKDRSKWRSLVKKSMKCTDDKLMKEYQRAHERRHTQPTSGLSCNLCHRLCRSRAGLVAHQRACKN